MDKITRFGAYGLFLKDNQILLTLKKSGPYKDRWGLPGGAIEFGETPEEALKREFLEETALAIDHLEILCTATANSTFEKNGLLHHFHHIGIIYRVTEGTIIPLLTPEEEGRFVNIEGINLDELTPFARYVLKAT